MRNTSETRTILALKGTQALTYMIRKGGQIVTSSPMTLAKALPSPSSKTAPRGGDHFHTQNSSCHKLVISAPHLDQLQQQIAHGSIWVKLDPHLYAQLAFVRFARRHNPALSSLLALKSHGKRVVGSLHDSLRVSQKPRVSVRKWTIDCGTEGGETKR